ncbi:hypothetical protein [Haloarcula argentinensis]|uniref:Uncharacterized protein n=1 Tax=Haloarcula argentinensis TaxID=43776 RepID=A0ABU2EYC3_HALAR|nr:hypothetical protein [Haloarcula argentinensis]MDS0253246.1 hypothetical protein [Haloarcula argentinensis]
MILETAAAGLEAITHGVMETVVQTVPLFEAAGIGLIYHAAGVSLR